MEKYTKSQRFAVFLSRLMMIHNVVMDVASFCGYNVATTMHKKDQILLKIAFWILLPELSPKYLDKKPVKMRGSHGFLTNNLSAYSLIGSNYRL